MNRSDRSAMEAYIQALLPERERYLHQHAQNKARVITRSMKPAEKEAYLQSEAFQTTLRQLQPRDKIWQGLLRGELVLSGDRAEFDRLSKLISREMEDGRKIDLAFLRTVEKSKISLEKAYEAIRIIREGDLRCWFDEQIGSFTTRAENRVVLWLRTGDHGARLREEEPERSVVRRIMEKDFPGGLTPKSLNRAFQPGSLDGFLRAEASKQFPELGACRAVRLPGGETVASAVRREAEREGRLVFNALEKKFSRERLRRLLEKNPALIRLQKRRTLPMKGNGASAPHCWTRFRSITGTYIRWHGRCAGISISIWGRPTPARPTKGSSGCRAPGKACTWGRCACLPLNSLKR